MNNVEKHETDETCNICGEKNVVSQYGMKRCDSINCPAAYVTTEIYYDSTDEEVEQWKEQQIVDTINSMTTAHIDGVDELERNDIIEIDADDLSGQWRVSDTEYIDVGLTEFHVASVVQDDDAYALIGPCTHGQGKTVQIRNVEDDDVVINVRPSDIQIVSS